MESAASSAEIAERYVSPFLLADLRREGQPDPPRPHDFQAAIALFDLKGFSTLAESTAAQGPAGLEALAELVNHRFGALVRTIHLYGGYVHQFPGDGAIAIWPAEDETLTVAVSNAACCALQLARTELGSTLTLPMKVGIGAGLISTAHVGGVEGLWAFLLSGEPFAEMGSAQRLAGGGEVVASSAVWKHLESVAIFRREQGDFRALEAVSGLGVPSPAVRVRSGDSRVGRYLPPWLTEQLGAYKSPAWLAEFRHLSILFVGLSDRTPEIVAEMFRRVQRATYDEGGSILRFGDDDKGLSILIAVGLPPETPESYAARAVRVALAIESMAADAGSAVRVGLATGPLFCGTLGAEDRLEYSVVGTVANRAARLMTAGSIGLRCDEATTQGCRNGQVFEASVLLELPGFDSPVRVFRPISTGRVSARPGRGGRMIAGYTTGSSLVVGRQQERAQLRHWLDRVCQGFSTTMVIRGEAGIGKTLLATELVASARAAGTRVMIGSCQPVGPQRTYHPWRTILGDALGLYEGPGLESRRQQATIRAEKLLQEKRLMPLLNVLVPLDLPETEATERMSGETRSDNLLGVAARLLVEDARERRTRFESTVIVIEDAHWIDAASLALLSMVRRSAAEAGLGLLVTTRPESPFWSSTESNAGEISVIDLEELSAEETENLICRRLGIQRVAAELSELIFTRTHGNPLFCEELVAAMNEADELRVVGGEGRLSPRWVGTDRTLPQSIADAVTSRISRIPSSLALTLKVASVVGEHFDRNTVAAIRPEHRVSGFDLDRELDELVTFDLLRREPRSTGAFHFKHIITREVAYGLLVFAQRRDLHRRLALHLEALGEDSVPRITLFRHWRDAGESARALAYVDAAGAEEMHQGAYAEAVEVFGYGLRESPRAPSSTPWDESEERTRAFWSRQLGEAQVALGLHAAARDSLEMALQLFGHPVFVRGARLWFGITAEAIRSVVATARVRGAQPSRASDRLALIAAAEVYEQLGYVHYSAGETALGLLAALKMLRLGERAGRSPVLARAYAAMSLTASVVRLRGLANVYEARAEQVAAGLGDRSTQGYVAWISAVRAVGEGKWDHVETGSSEAFEAGKQLGDHRLCLMSLQTAASGCYLRGDLAAARSVTERQLALARRCSNRLWEAWALNSLSEITSFEGANTATIGQCHRALEILARESDRTEEVRALGLLAVAELRRGRTDESLEIARRIRGRLATMELTTFVLLEGLTGMCEVFLSAAERAAERAGLVPSSLRADAEWARAALGRFARVFPIGRPRYLVVAGRCAALGARNRRAARFFERAVAAAATVGMTQDRGLALLAAARSRATDGLERVRMASEAVSELQPGWGREQARALLRPGLEDS